MNRLLAEIIERHGGLTRWHAHQRVDASIVSGGGLWAMKGLVQNPHPRQMTVWLHQERASLTPFGDPLWRTEFCPSRIAITTLEGAVVKERTRCFA